MTTIPGSVQSGLDPLAAAIAALAARLRALETADRAEIGGGVAAVTFAGLPPAGQPGRLRFVTDGLKVGEGPGTGSGVLAVDDGAAWYSVATDTPVTV